MFLLCLGIACTWLALKGTARANKQLEEQVYNRPVDFKPPSQLHPIRVEDERGKGLQRLTALLKVKDWGGGGEKEPRHKHH